RVNAGPGKPRGMLAEQDQVVGRGHVEASPDAAGMMIAAAYRTCTGVRPRRSSQRRPLPHLMQDRRAGGRLGSTLMDPSSTPAAHRHRTPTTAIASVLVLIMLAGMASAQHRDLSPAGYLAMIDLDGDGRISL